MILEYLPYVLLFALATMIIYAWGLWRSIRQQQDLSNMLSAKGISKVKKAHKKSDSKAALQQGADCCNGSETVSRLDPPIYDKTENDHRNTRKRKSCLSVTKITDRQLFLFRLHI